jgi:hypothetical protein
MWWPTALNPAPNFKALAVEITNEANTVIETIRARDLFD